jgi:hypothetical protein
MTRRTLLVALFGAALASLGACLSPTLPLPPPEEPSEIARAGTDGMWKIQGSCSAGAMVLIRNERTGVITGTEDTHAALYAVEVAAVECDPATVFEVVDETMTSGTSFLVRAVINGVPQNDCADAGP